ncbi:hypothetical protein HYV43_05665 [Candidatus Micrarchaeota archaeon]|nr:hypothetical protein [Candidatus Micrarchaeota archaeon]
MNALIAVALFFALFLAGCVQNVQTPSSSKLATFASPDAGFSIKYPQGWSVHETPDEVYSVQIESYGEEIRVASHDNSVEKMSLKDLASTLVAGMKDGAAEQNAGTIDVVFDGPTVVNGYDAHAVVLEPQDDIGVKRKAVVIQSKKSPGKVFLVIVGSLKNTFTSNSALYESIFQSFQEN